MWRRGTSGQGGQEAMAAIFPSARHSARKFAGSMGRTRNFSNVRSIASTSQPRFVLSSRMALPSQHFLVLRSTAVARRHYAQQAGPQDFTDEEAREIENRRRSAAAQKAPSAALIKQRRIDELMQAADKHITEEKWVQAEDRLNTILDLQQGQVDDEAFQGRALVKLAFAEQNMGKRHKAEQHYAEGIAALRKALGEDHYEVGHGLVNYAEALAFVEKVEQAEATSKQALPIMEKNYGKQSELVGALLSNLGGYLCAQKKFEEAEPILSRALNVLERALGRNNEYTSACLLNYARLLSDLQRPEQVKALKEKYSDQANTISLLEGLEKEEPSPQIKEVMDQFKNLADARAFNPDGMFKPDAFHKEELKQFITKWENKHQGPLDADLIPSVLEELESIPEEEFDEMCNDAMREMAKERMAVLEQGLSGENAEVDEDDTDDVESGESDTEDDEGDDDDDDDDEEEYERLDEGDQEEDENWKAIEAHERAEKQQQQHIDIDLTDTKTRS